MTGRALAFADPEIVATATRDYVPVVGDDWYQRRREDAEGAFFRKAADQGPQSGKDGATRQGVYCLTADGELLVYKNAGQLPDVMRDVLRLGLERFRALPAERTRPGAIKLSDADANADGALRREDPRFVRRPPAGGLIVRVHTRALDAIPGPDGRFGGYADAVCTRGDAAARDHCWIRSAEAALMLPPQVRVGQSLPLPKRVAERLLRFHFVDDTRGEPLPWLIEEIRAYRMTLTVTHVTRESIVLRLQGTATLATDADLSQAVRGYEAQVLGELRYDRIARGWERWDVVAVGPHWGEFPGSPGARPGRHPLGIAFSLLNPKNADPETLPPADRIPPQAARNLADYWGASPSPIP